MTGYLKYGNFDTRYLDTRKKIRIMELTIKIQINTDEKGNIVIDDIAQTIDVVALTKGDLFHGMPVKKGYFLKNQNPNLLFAFNFFKV